MQESYTVLLISQLKQDDNAPYRRRIAMNELRNLGPSVIPTLLSYLPNDNLWITSAILELLGDFRAANTIPEILKYLDSDETMVVRKALQALAKIGDPNVVPKIIEIMQVANWHIKNASAEALSEFFQNLDQFEYLYTQLLIAYIEKQNREDYLLVKFEEVGWNAALLENEYRLMIEYMLDQLEQRSATISDFVILKYFKKDALNLIELRLSNKIEDLSTQNLKKVYDILLKSSKITMTNHLDLVI